MTVEATAQEATNETAIDVSELPASAFPEGVDPSTYIAGLAATKGATPEDKTAAPARPDHVPEKFWNPETGAVDTDAVLKSYAELEKKFSGAKTEAEGEKSIKLDVPETPDNAPLVSAIEAFKAHYAESNGSPSDDQIAALEKVGLPRELIDDYLAGVKAREQLAEAQSYGMAAEVFGSPEAFDKAFEWAKSKLSKADADAYDGMITGGHARQGVEWLKAKYESANPSEGSFIETEAGGAQGDVFRSKAEMTTAFQDPRYRSDTAYQKDMAEKFARSKAAGTL